jgi:hypothetical protein
MKYKVEIQASITYRTEVAAVSDEDAIEWAIQDLEDIVGTHADVLMIHKTKILERENDDG